MRKGLLLIISLLIAVSVQSQTFHAVIFADTYDEVIGESCLHDYEGMEVSFATMARASSMQLKSYAYRDYQFTRDNLNRIIEEIQCGPDDVIFFYYSGHGVRAEAERSQWPQLCFGHEEEGIIYKKEGDFLPMEQLQVDLNKKNARLCVLMADCCNEVIPGLKSKPVSRGGATLFTKPENAYKVYQQFFREVKGSVMVTSSSPGEQALGDEDGGYFTNAFLEEFSNAVNSGTAVNWEGLLRNSAKTTHSMVTNPDKMYFPQFQVSVAPYQMPPLVAKQTPDLGDQVAGLTNKKVSTSERVKKIDPVYSELFASGALVEVYAQSGVLLEREEAKDFLKRIVLSRKLVDVVTLDIEQNDQGKVQLLKVHEIYKE